MWILTLACLGAHAQWTLQDSGTTASLRGIHSLGGGVAWASGSGGTVLRTVDDGAHWLHCAVPDADKDGAKLDFRGVQAFDAKTAIVMSSGKGDLSRLYKTVDGCGTWKLELTNDDPDGFWDSMRLWSANYGYLLGDAVNGKMTILEKLYSPDFGQWSNYDYLPSFTSQEGPGESAFAASNSCIALGEFTEVFGKVRDAWFATGGVSGSWVRQIEFHPGGEPETFQTRTVRVKGFPETASGGIFSIAFRDNDTGVAVGGDYLKPLDGTQSAAVTKDAGLNWTPSKTQPHGYRSAVAFASNTRSWLAVGPSGTDASTDDGLTWHALTPGQKDALDADKNWNALSLPFVVGAKGRIGLLRAGALGPPKPR